MVEPWKLEAIGDMAREAIDTGCERAFDAMDHAEWFGVDPGSEQSWQVIGVLFRWLRGLYCEKEVIELLNAILGCSEDVVKEFLADTYEREA